MPKVALTRSWLRLAVAAVVVLATIAFPTSPASAHTDLASSTPSDGAQLESAPTTVSLTFTDPIQSAFTTVTLAVGDEAPATLALTTEGRTLTIPVPESIRDRQAIGSTLSWAVTYRTVADDGHPIDGVLSFTVTAASEPTPPPAAAPTAEGSLPRSRQDETAGYPWAAIAVLAAGTAGAGLFVWLFARRSKKSKHS
ncbi:copper resistance CopC family protein [Microbacterium maritypicum]